MGRDILTEASAPNGGGFADWGRLSRDEIIRRTKELAAHEVKKWEEVLATPNDEFDCCIISGVHRRKLIEKLPACPLQKKLIEAEAHLSVFTAALSKREIFKTDQLEMSDHQYGPWEPLSLCGSAKRFVRVKPSEFEGLST
jgi:hypothetical protein